MYRPHARQLQSLSKSRRLVSNNFFLVLTLLVLASSIGAQGDKNTHPLELSRPVECELTGGQSQVFSIVLTTDQYIEIAIDHKGTDLIVSLLDPDNGNMRQSSTRNRPQTQTIVLGIAEKVGTYHLEIHLRRSDASKSRLEVKMKELRPALREDKSRVVADQTFAEAEILSAKRTTDSMQTALRKYQEARLLYHTISDRDREAVTLTNIGTIYYLTGAMDKVLENFLQALPIYHESSNSMAEATTLNDIGVVYYSLGEKKKALSCYEQALALRNFIVDKHGQAETLSNMGALYSSVGENQKALDYLAQALPVFHAIDDTEGEAKTLNNIGAVYDAQGEKKKAWNYYEQSLPLRRAIRDVRGEAVTLDNIGKINLDLGDKKKALEYFEQVLPLRRVLGDIRGEAITLNNIGRVYDDSGESKTALDYYNQALPLSRTAQDRSTEATTLNNIGRVYDELSDKQKALYYYEASLPILRAVQDRNTEASTLNNIGMVHDDLGHKVIALNYYGEALQLFRAIGAHGNEARTLGNIGVLYFSLGEREKALDFYEQALALASPTEDRAVQASLLVNIGNVYEVTGTPVKAGDYYEQSLLLSAEVGDLNIQAKALGHLMFFCQSRGDYRLAIFYGKESVEVLQRLRVNIRGLDISLQRSYLKSVNRTFRGLSELLIKQGRFAEAQNILNVFKDEEFFDFDRQNSEELLKLALTSSETEFLTRYHKASESVATISYELTQLKLGSDNRQRNSDHSIQLQNLESKLKIASDDFLVVLNDAKAHFLQKPDASERIREVTDTLVLQTVLRRVTQETGQKSVAVYTLVGETSFNALVITADSIVGVSVEGNTEELNAKARKLWALFKSPDYDPRILSNELYNTIFQPIENKLPKDTKTIIWSLDGNLRYIPMSALYDGKKYLIERFNHVIFTRADKERLTRTVSVRWTGYGFSSSAPHTVTVAGSSVMFGPLDFAKVEMQIFRTKSFPTGIIDGDIFPDEQFTKASLLAALKTKRPLVHISSHFSFRAGDETQSLLLFGNGQFITIAEMKTQPNLFQGIELLTLSACDTAAQRPDATGREVDTFAELAQRLGASGVMASLWSVSEMSTAELMTAFYKKREVEQLTKAEALRQAQMDLLYGRNSIPIVTKQVKASTKDKNTADEGVYVEPRYRVLLAVDKKKPFAHPYYWAPFVLFGNWK